MGKRVLRAVLWGILITFLGAFTAANVGENVIFTLLLYLLQFFKLWARMEDGYLGRTGSTVEDGRFSRPLVLRGEADGADSEAVGEAIAAYIDVFDRSLKTYFANLDDPQRALALIRRLYAAQLHQQPLLV